MQVFCHLVSLQKVGKVMDGYLGEYFDEITGRKALLPPVFDSPLRGGRRRIRVYDANSGKIPGLALFVAIDST